MRTLPLACIADVLRYMKHDNDIDEHLHHESVLVLALCLQLSTISGFLSEKIRTVSELRGVLEEVPHAHKISDSTLLTQLGPQQRTK